MLNTPTKAGSAKIDWLRKGDEIVAVYSQVFLVPYGQTYLIAPQGNSNWKVTTVAAKGPSFSFYFGHRDNQGNIVGTEEIRRDDADLRTEIYITSSSFIVFDNNSSKNLYGFFSAVDA